MTPKLTVLATRRIDSSTLDSGTPKIRAATALWMSWSACEGPDQRRVAREVGQDAQLDLRVVGRQEPPAGSPGHERLADLPAVLGADRNVLEVGVAGAEPARRRHALVERGVDPAVVGVDQAGQGVEIRALELGELAVLQEQARAAGACRPAPRARPAPCSARRRASSGADGSFSFSKSTSRSCGPRVDVERPAGQLVDLVLDRRQPARRTRADSSLSRRTSTFTPAASIPARTEIKRAFQLGVERPRAPRPCTFGRQDRLDPPGRVGVLAGVLGHLGHLDLVHPAPASSPCRSGR